MDMHGRTTADSDAFVPSLRFSIPGRICPNNVYTRKYNNVSVKNARAREDLALIAQIAGAAADVARWRTLGEGEAASLEIVLWNQMGDIDARPKIILDGLQQIAYDNDKRVKRLLLTEDLDYGGPRCEVFVEPMPIPERRPKPRKMRYIDLSVKDLLILTGDQDSILDPSPGIVLPLPVTEAPEAWVKRASKDLKAQTLLTLDVIAGNP